MKYLKPYNIYNESIKDFLKPKSGKDLYGIYENLTWNERFEYGCQYGILSWVVNSVEIGNVHPANMNNNGIQTAANFGNFDIVEYLLNDNRVRNSLSYGRYQYFKKMLIDNKIDISNESVRDYLKPKSKEQIDLAREHIVIDFFNKAYGIGYCNINLSKYDDRWTDWKKYAEKFNLFSYFYLYKDKIMMIQHYYLDDNIMHEKLTTDIGKFKLLIKNNVDKDKVRNMIKGLQWWQKMKVATKCDLLWLAKDLMSDKRFASDWNGEVRHFFHRACQEGAVDIVKYLLSMSDEIKDFDPSVVDNGCIKSTWNKEIYDILIKIPSVYNTLSDYDKKWLEEKRSQLSESVRDYLKPKPKEEVIKQLGGREDAVFKPTDRYPEISHFIGTYRISYKDLEKIFGYPNTDGDGYKISTDWILEDDKGNLVSISDYKETNLYDPSYPSIEEFRDEPFYDWNIFSDNKDILNDLKTFIYLKSLNINESIRSFLKPKSEEDILDKFENMTDDEALKKASEYGVLSVVKDIIKRKNLSPDSYDLYIALSISTLYEQIEIVKYLVFEIGVNPFIEYFIRDPYTFNVYMSSFNTAKDYKYGDIVIMLLNDSRVTDYIPSDMIDYYKRLYGHKL